MRAGNEFDADGFRQGNQQNLSKIKGESSTNNIRTGSLDVFTGTNQKYGHLYMATITPLITGDEAHVVRIQVCPIWKRSTLLYGWGLDS